MVLRGEHSNIAIIIGTKAELIKCMPIMLELQKQRKEYWFIHTGQHALGKACVDFGIKEPDFILSKEPERSTKFWSKINKNSLFWFFIITSRIRKLLKKIKPKYVVYHGDTMSTAAASIASSKLLSKNKNWRNVHLEAGLRSGDLFEPFPEEISRKISDRFSDILLAVSDFSESNIRKDKLKGKIVKVGNTIVDSSLIAYKKANKRKKISNFVLINIHRHENISDKKRLTAIVNILKAVKIKAIWPIHANTAHFLEKYGLVSEIRKMKNIELVSLMGYSDFIYLLAKCKYIIADGGSIQEESLVFKKPCLILRKRTERQEGLSTGINFLTGLSVNYSRKIIEDIEEGIIKPKKGFKNPYGEAGVSKKIVELLK